MSKAPDNIDLTAAEREEVAALLQRYLPDTEVWAYGSRVKFTANPHSDLDMVAFAAKEQSQAVANLREAFEESYLPFRVDLFVWDEVPENFHGNIEEARVVLQKEKKGCKLPEGWQSISFSDAVHLNPTVKLTKGNRYPFVDMKSLNPACREVVPNEMRTFQSGGAKFLPKDTLLARITPCLENGKIARYNPIRTNREAFGSTEFIVIRGKDGVTDNDFVYYLTIWPEFRKFAISQMTGSSGRQRVPVGSLAGFTFNLPPLPEQKAIAHILGSLDDKIELNRRMNETLEAMAQAIFKDWFVDFGPTLAKAEGRAPYLTSEIWDIFPDALDDEDKPVGWRIGSIGDLADTNHQSWTVRNHPVAVEYVDLSNAKWGNIDAVTALAWEDAPSRARRVARMGDTIVGTTRPGNGSFVYISQNGLTVSTGFAVLSPREVIYRDVVYIAATRLDNIERLANLADGHGGAYPAVKPKEVSDTELVLPGDAVLSAFADLVSPLRAKIENVKVDTRSLSQTRDLLLPKLMSGEIRFREAERTVEAVV